MGQKTLKKLLKPAKGLREFVTPEGFEGGIRRLQDRYDADGNLLKGKEVVKGTAEEFAHDQAETLSDSLLKAQKEFRSAKKKGGKTPLTNAAVEQIKTFAINAKPDSGGEAVTGSMASALMSLDADYRRLILRRAGNPEVFEPLNNADLEATPVPEMSPEAREFVSEEATEAAKNQPVPFREGLTGKLSSQFQKEDIVDPDTGEVIKKGSEAWKNMRIDNRPQALREREGDSDRSIQLRKLAGDQIAELIAIQRSQGVENLPSVEDAIRALTRRSGTPKTDAEIAAAEWVKRNTAPGGFIEDSTAMLPPAVRVNPDRDSVAPSDVVLKTGTGADPGGPSTNPFNPNLRHSAGDHRSIDSAISREVRTNTDRVLELLNRRTDGELAEVEGSSYMKPIDLDVYFPWWRSRLGDVLGDGSVDYPDHQLTPEVISSIIQGMYKNTDRSFIQRISPLIQKSIDYTLGLNGSPVKKGAVRTRDIPAEARKGMTQEEIAAFNKQRRKEAAEVEKRDKIVDASAEAYVPGPTYRKAMSEYRQLTNPGTVRIGVGEVDANRVKELRDLLYGSGPEFQIYSDVPMTRAAPASNPDEMTPEVKPQGKQQKARKTDQASIRTVPGILDSLMA